MTKLAVACLGSGAALGGTRLWSSLLLDDRILLSIPPTAIPGMYRLGKDLTDIDVIFISHCHADHFFGLPFFFLLYRFVCERDAPVFIVGPDGIQDATLRLGALAWPELVENGIVPRVPIEYVEIEKEGEYRAGDLRFRAIGMQHFGAKAFGYRFSYQGREIAYTGDTEAGPHLDRLTSGADLVVTEWTYTGVQGKPGHLCSADIADLAARLSASHATILASHLGGNPEPIKGVIVCRDGETYWV